MVSYSDEFKINQNILWIVFFELGIILYIFFWQLEESPTAII